MKNYIFICMLMLKMIMPISADYFVVMDGEDYTVYNEQGMHHAQSIASVSKIMTAIVAIEKGNIEDCWSVGEEIKNSYGSSIYLEIGQKVNMIDLLYGLLLESGNDAADALCYHVGGNNSEQFLEWMNDLAYELGMRNTIYRNPSGLDEDDGGNISTPYDQALLMVYALQNDVFRQITATKYYTTTNHQQYVNHNKLLWNFAYTIGGKTGYTQKAQHTLTSASRLDGMTCIVVSFHMGDEASFHKQQCTNFYNEIQAFPIVSAQVVKIGDELIIIDQPFIVHGTLEEFEKGKVEVYVDKENHQVVVEWRTDIRVVKAYYSFV